MTKKVSEIYRLLLVDDDSAFLTTTKLGLERNFQDIEVVAICEIGAHGSDQFRSAGQNAMDYLERVWSGDEDIVHCILIDHNMPGMTGLELLREIKSKDTYAPVIMLTGADIAMQGESIRSFENGARGYLFKSSEMFLAELNTTIHRVYQEVIREKWLETLANISSIDTKKIYNRKLCAEFVTDTLKTRFPRSVIFIREKKDENRLHLLASVNVADDLLERLADICLDDFPFAKKTFEYHRSTFDNDAWKWSKELLGDAVNLPLNFDRAFFVPLRYANEQLGSLAIYMEKTQGFFLKEEQNYADTMAKIVASLFFQYDYRNKLRTQTQNVTDIIKHFNAAENEDTIYELLANHIHKEVNIRTSGFWRGKTSVKKILVGTDRMDLVALHGEQRQKNCIFRVSDKGNGISGWVAYHGKPRLIGNKNECEETWVNTRADMVSSVTVPLLNEIGRVIAVLNTESTEPGHFLEDDLSYTESLSHVAAVYAIRLRNQHFFDTILKILADKNVGSSEMLRQVIETIKEYVGYSAMIVAVRQSNGVINLVRSDGFTETEEGLVSQALRHELSNVRPLILEALHDRKEYLWNRGDENQLHRPWFPSPEMEANIKSQYVFLLKLSTGEPMGAFSLEFEIENAVDRLQKGTIQKILPIIARLLWDAETHSALKQEIDILKVESAFSIALRQIAHNIHHLSFNIGGQAFRIEDTENLTKAGKQRVEKIVAFASELDKLEDNIRSLSRELKPKMMEILPCWNEVAEIFVTIFKHHNISILVRIPEGCVIWCDPLALKTVLMNLVDNSVQAIMSDTMKSNPQILVSYIDSKDFGCLRIEDNGPGFKGITPERALEWFTTTRSAGGSGIGLPFSDKLIRNCEGELKIAKPKELSGAAIEIVLRKKTKGGK